MNDRELLELAAKAAGEKGQIRNCTWGGKQTVALERRDGAFWAPLDDDGDTLRLAVTLRLDVLQDELSVSVKRWNKAVADSDYLSNVSVGESRLSATRLSTTRRAIVLAAAEIGRSMP